MYNDHIIKEVWKNRDAYTEAHHHNISEIVADLRKRESQHPEKIINNLRASRTNSNTK